MNGKIILVTGGARSGKSSFAEKLVAGPDIKVAYIATAQALDSEMAERISLHRSRRPVGWRTYEAFLDAEMALKDALVQADAVLFDCLTMYVSNMLLAVNGSLAKEERLAKIRGKIDELLKLARESDAMVVFVTNEVGLGIVPDNTLAREYRDLSGLVNQQVAAAADEVYLMVSGLALTVKSSH